MPDHLIITVTESDCGTEYLIESDAEATDIAAVCAMTSAIMVEAKRMHDEAHYLDGVKN